MIATIEDRLKKDYRPSFADDAWVDELFADALVETENRDNWFNEICSRCPYFVDGAKTGDYIERLVEASTDDPEAIEATEAVNDAAEPVPGDAPKLMKWAKVPLIRCVRPEATECSADSFIVTAFVFSQIAREKQVLEYMQERILKRQQDHKQAQSNYKRNKVVKRRRGR